jgi:hypothetical protein
METIGKTIKPRNPHAIAAKKGNAGAHGSHQAKRRERRAEKQSLRALVRTQGINRDDYFR